MPIIVPTPSSTGASTPTVLSDLIGDYLPGYMKSSDDGTLRALVDAIALPVADRVRLLSDPAYSADEYTVPFARLPWLAAMAGIDLTAIPDLAFAWATYRDTYREEYGPTDVTGACNARKRAVVADPDYRYRGSATAIRKRVGETLTGAKQVQIVCPYTGDPDAILVRTYAAETPDATVTEAAIRAEVPAWMELTADVAAAGIDYDELASRYATYDDMTTTGKTYDELSQET